MLAGKKVLGSKKSGAPARSADSNSDLLGGIVDGVKDFFGIGTRRAEDKDKEATVAVFDSFNGADDEGVSTHGEQVEGIIQNQTGLEDKDVQRFQISSQGSLDGLKEDLADGDEGSLEGYVEDRYTSLLDNTSGAIEEILEDENSQIRVINQSQSVAEGRIARDLWREAGEDDEFRADLAESIGLDANVGDRELAQALVDELGSIVEGNDAIQDSLDHFDETSQRAKEAGITHVVTSGNLGRFAETLDNLGVNTDRQFYDSAFANGHSISVAATDGQMTREGTDDTNAVFNSPNANADIAAPGVDIGLVTQDGERERNSGTSFAAPLVTAAIHELLEANEDLSPQNIERILERSATNIDEDFTEIGHGVLNPDNAIGLAADWVA